MTILAVIAATSGSLMVFASLPQIIKIYRRKSAKDISAISYSLFAINNLIWILYGIELSSYAVILSNFFKCYNLYISFDRLDSLR